MNRKHTLLTAAGTALGAGMIAAARWWRGGPSLVEADRSAHTERELFDRGLIGIDRSGWTKPHGQKPPYASLQKSITADVAIIGAGLAGSSLALHLAEAGVSVAVVEARQPGWGASGRNAGHVLPTLRSREVFESFPDKGARFFAAFAEHRGLPFALAKRHGIDCDAVQAGYLHVGRKGPLSALRKQMAWMVSGGLLAAKDLGGSDLHRETGTTHWDHGLLFPEGGRINPYLFTNGMVEAAVRLGAQVFGDSPALSMANIGERWIVRTAHGDVTADKVVFCTAAYPDGIEPAFTKAFYPLASYALATKPLPPEVRAIILPTQRTLAQAPVDLNPLVRDHMDRLILAGIPSRSRPEDGAAHFRHHLDWIRRVWPQARDVDIELESYWTGRVAFRDDNFPGAFELERGVFGLMYFNAWGNLMAPLMGKLLAEALARDRPDTLPFPLGKPIAVASMNKQDRLIRTVLVPAAQRAQRMRLLD